MIAVDTNVLVHAHRPGSLHHAAAAAQLRKLAEGLVPWGVPVFVLGEFVRVVTHRRVFANPSTLDDAFGYLDAVLESPSVRLLSPGPRFVELFRDLARRADARANLAFDAQIAAVCLENGAHRLLTGDRDFLRFPDLEVLPLDRPSPG